MPSPNKPLMYCAHPDCENLVEQPEDRSSLRKYCCDEHRIEARRLRQRARAAEAVPEPPVRARSSKATGWRATNRDVVRRAVLAAGTAALLAVTVLQVARTTGSDQPVATPPPSTSAAPQSQRPPVRPAPVDPVTTPDLGTWAERAQLALTAVEALLDQVRAAEVILQTLPESSRARLRPSRTRELAERKNRLLAQRAALGTALDAYAQLPRTQENLAAAEEQLATVDSALQAQQAGRSRSLTDQLTEQRDILRRESESLREEQARWRRTVDAAVAAPLPSEEDAKGTASILDEVLELTRDHKPDRPKRDRPRPERPRDPRPIQAPPAQDSSPQRTRDTTTVGAPPVPNPPAPKPPPVPKPPPAPRPPENPKPDCPTTATPKTKQHHKDRCGPPKPKPPPKPPKPGKPDCRIVPKTATKTPPSDKCSPPKPKPPPGDKCGAGKNDKKPILATRTHRDNCDKGKKPLPAPRPPVVEVTDGAKKPVPVNSQ